MENLPKKEAFVPDESQEEFKRAASKGETQEQVEAEKTERAKYDTLRARDSAVSAGLAGALGAVGVATGSPFTAVGGLGMAAVFGKEAIGAKKDAVKHAGEAADAKARKEDSYTKSRSFVKEPESPADIEIARKEMERDMEKHAEESAETE